MRLNFQQLFQLPQTGMKMIKKLFLPNNIAHRGASAYCPENTRSAFVKAAELGASMVEFDVQLTRDGVPVVFHDDTLNRTSNGKGRLDEHSYDSLKELDFGHWFSNKFKGETLLSLRECLQLVQNLGLKANIEIKSPTPELRLKTATAVLICINEYWDMERSEPLISSFDKHLLFQIRELSPDILLGYLCYQWDESWYQFTQKCNCYSIHLYWRLLNTKRIDQIKKTDLKLLSYVFNRSRRATKWISKGVDAVFSDYPDLL